MAIILKTLTRCVGSFGRRGRGVAGFGSVGTVGRIARAVAMSVVSLMGVVGIHTAARADTYPTHAIHLIITGAPGGASDTIGRVIAERLGAVLGQAIVVDNRPGAGTMLASQLEAAAVPDGYTIMLMTNSHTINAAIRKSMPYDPVKDFTEVSLLATQPNLVVVSNDLPVHSLQDLIDLARKEPGKINYGSGGVGSAAYMAGELFKSVTGVNLLHVPYKGGTPAQMDLLAGRVKVLFFPLVDTFTYAKTNQLRALAITADQRSPLLPNVPTNAEAGVPGVEAGAWYGIAAPAKTPPAVVTTLNRALLQVLKDANVRRRLIESGCEIVGSTPEYFSKYMLDDIALWKKLVAKEPGMMLD